MAGIESEKDPLRKEDLLRELVRTELSTHLTSLPELAAQLQDDQSINIVVAEVTRLWAGDRWRGLFEFSKSNLTGQFRNLLQSGAVINALRSRDVRQAAAMLDEMPFSTERSQMLSRVAAEFVKLDPKEALDWARKMTWGEDKVTAQSELLNYAAGQKDPAAYMRAVLSSSDSPRIRSEAIQRIVRTEMERGPVDKTLAWIGSLSGADRDTGYLQYIALVPLNDFEGMNSIMAKIQDPKAQTSAVRAVVVRSAQKDPAATAGWVLNSFPPTTKEPALRSLVNTWYNQDSHQLMDWVESLPKGIDRDIALSSLVPIVASVSADTARNYANAIGDKSLRDRANRAINR
jgi:hypothetical protein